MCLASQTQYLASDESEEYRPKLPHSRNIKNGFNLKKEIGKRYPAKL